MTRLLLGIMAGLFIASVISLLIGIWGGDARWVPTGVVLMLAGVLCAVAAAATAE